MQSSKNYVSLSDQVLLTNLSLIICFFYDRLLFYKSLMPALKLLIFPSPFIILMSITYFNLYSNISHVSFGHTCQGMKQVHNSINKHILRVHVNKPSIYHTVD